MPKPWSAVETNPEYQSLPPEQKTQAQEQYFNSVVAPQIQDPKALQDAHSAFIQRAQGGIKNNTQGPSRVETALAGAIPGGQTYEAFKNPQSTVMDKVGAASGDLLNGALYAGSGGLSGVAKQAALGAAGGALAPELGKLSQSGSDMGGDLMRKYYSPITNLIPENSGSVPLQFAKRLPETLGQIGGSALPQAALALLGKGMQGTSGESLSQSPVAAQLEKLGGETTAAQNLNPGIPKSILSAYETTMARTNPLLINKFNSIDAANAGAVKNAAQGSFGPDILDPQSAANTGTSLKGNLDTLAKQRSEAYAPAVDALKGGKGYTKFGKDIVSAALSAGDENRVLPDVADFWRKNAGGLAKANTPADIDLQMQNMRSRFSQQYAGLKQADASVYGNLERSFAVMEGAAKSAYYDGLNRVQPPVLDAQGNVTTPGLGDQIREAKGDYGDASQAMSPLSKALATRSAMPEKVGPAVLNSGSNALSDLSSQMDPATQANFQKNMARTILEQAKTPEGISSVKLGSALNKNRSALESGLGNQLQPLQNLQDLASTAGQNNIGTANPSGSFNQVAKGSHLAALLDPILWPKLALKTAADAGYAYGAKPVLNVAGAALNQVPAMAPSLSQSIGMANQGEQNNPQNDALRQFLASRLNPSPTGSLRQALK